MNSTVGEIGGGTGIEDKQPEGGGLRDEVVHKKNIKGVTETSS